MKRGGRGRLTGKSRREGKMGWEDGPEMKDGKLREWRTSKMSEWGDNKMTKGREFCKRIKNEIKWKHLARTAADDRHMIERRRETGWSEGVLRERWAFISDSNRADRQHPGGQQRAESSQGRQKAYSSLESSLDNPHTQTWTEDAQAPLPRYNPHTQSQIHTPKQPSWHSASIWQQRKKIVSVDSFNTKRAERQKSLIHVGLNTETRTFQTICWTVPSPRPCVYNYCCLVTLWLVW